MAEGNQSHSEVIDDVLREAHHPLHYLVITQRVLRKKEMKGATPERTISRELSTEFKKGHSSKYERVAPGTYKLKNYDWRTSLLAVNHSMPSSAYAFRLQGVDIINFRLFADRYIELADQFTVLIGDNGSGKSALLDALVVGISTFFLGIDRLQARNIRSDDIHGKLYGRGYEIHREVHLPVIVSCIGIVGDKRTFWTRTLQKEKGKTDKSGATEIIDIAQEIQRKVRQNEAAIIPIIAYYGTGRLWSVKQDKEVFSQSTLFDVQSRLAGYDDCLSPFTNDRALVDWFKQRTLIELQESQNSKSKDQLLSAVSNALTECMSGEGWSNIRYALNINELIVTRNGEEFMFRLLSDGVRNMLAMVADIAIRATRLNPYLGSNAVRSTPGIVLIDEIDLHLHPSWQRTVVDDLKRTFPHVQFVATTHSPIIIQSLRPGELIDLNQPRIGEPVAEYSDRGIEEIVEEIMGVNQVFLSERSQRIQKATERFLAKSMNSKNLPQSVDEDDPDLNEIIELSSNDPALIAMLKLQRLALQSKSGTENETH